MRLLKEGNTGVTIYRVHEERLDTLVAPDLKTEILVDLNAGNKRLLIDLKNVKYIDSSGLGALLFGLRQLREIEGDLKLLNAAPRVLKLIEIGHLEKHLLNFEDELSAINSFNI
jgi:anti-anti-sigma factor